MKQYLDLLQTIKDKGTQKPAAREGMPGTLSYFGYQFRHDLANGFPLLTTKKMFWKAIVVELLWFLRGDTNIKYLVDNGVNIWNEDAYNYYRKIIKQYKLVENDDQGYTFEEFVTAIKEQGAVPIVGLPESIYKLGDCGHQYGKLWRDWENFESSYGYTDEYGTNLTGKYNNIDQIQDLINGLKKNPMGRRHIITAWNPATLDKMALNACHVLVQFNCRPLDNNDKHNWLKENNKLQEVDFRQNEYSTEAKYLVDKKDFESMPKYYLDCQLYQRSADVVLGVPFNIASYALLTHILSKICNFVPGEFIHTFGDVHIYDNHMDAVNEQLTREPRELPTLLFKNRQSNEEMHEALSLDEYFKWLNTSNFVLQGYDPHPAIKAELSTGLRK